MQEREDDEHVGQINLIAASTEKPERTEESRALPPGARRRDGHQACSDREDSFFQSGRSQWEQERETRESKRPDDKRKPRPSQSPERWRRKSSMRDE